MLCMRGAVIVAATAASDVDQLSQKWYNYGVDSHSLGPGYLVRFGCCYGVFV